MTEEKQDKQVFVVIHLSWQVTSYVIRASGEVKIILFKKQKSSKSKSDYKAGKEKIDKYKNDKYSWL